MLGLPQVSGPWRVAVTVEDGAFSMVHEPFSGLPTTAWRDRAPGQGRSATVSRYGTMYSRWGQAAEGQHALLPLYETPRTTRRIRRLASVGIRRLTEFGRTRLAARIVPRRSRKFAITAQLCAVTRLPVMIDWIARSS